MRCSRLETRLNELLDARQDPLRDPEIAAHTADCRRCRRLTAAYVALCAGAEQLTVDAPFVERVAPPRRRVAATTAGFAVAAALALLFTRPTAEAPQLAPPPSRTAVAEAKPAPASTPPAVAEVVLDTSRAYADLIHEAARGIDEALLLASTYPPVDEYLDPVLFPEDGLLRQFDADWLLAAADTLDVEHQRGGKVD